MKLFSFAKPEVVEINVKDKAWKALTSTATFTADASVAPIKAIGFIAGKIAKLAKQGYDQA